MANTQISHNGEVIATLNGGQTATLKCAGMQMVTDVVVDVAELSLQEKTVTENGEVTPDEGYAGLSKVTVNVQGEVVEEYDGSVREQELLTLTASDGYVLTDSNGLKITMWEE